MLNNLFFKHKTMQKTNLIFPKIFLAVMVALLAIFTFGQKTNAANWSISTIDSAGDVGYHTSLALDSNNKVHISYWDRTNEDLKYATNASGSWVVTTLDSDGKVGEFSSLALDSNNKVHISYYDYTHKDLKYATNALNGSCNNGWYCTTVDSNGDVGYFSSLALDSNNKVHISYYYYDGTKGYLKYATNASSSGEWVTTILDDSADNVG